MSINRRNFLIGTSSIVGLAGLGAYGWDKRWTYIVIHHSAGRFGNIAFLQQVHRERQAGDPIDAIPYHYVIGNGNGLGLGEIVSDWRQEYDLWGAHVSGNNKDRNFRGIGICLIGNFEHEQIQEKQYFALVNLTRKLMSKYSIPIENVTGHGRTPGESTKCPGKLFPYEQFYKDIS